VAYRYKKPYRIKKRKLILRNRFLWIAALVLLLLGSIAYLLLFSRVFQIKEVAITGANEVSQEEIRSFFPANNIFLIDTAEIKKNILNTFPEIAEVKIDRSLPATLNVEIKERVAAIIWCKEERECFLVDQTGTVFAEAFFEETDLLKVFAEKELLQEKAIGQILEIDSKFKKDLHAEIEKILFVSLQRLNVKTVEGWEIYFNLEKDLTWQLTQLHLVLQRQISPEERESLQYIDLRFARVFYK
jgi:cell division septal protein FtsQ